jgi:hypothetical protein
MTVKPESNVTEIRVVYVGAIVIIMSAAVSVLSIGFAIYSNIRAQDSHRTLSISTSSLRSCESALSRYEGRLGAYDEWLDAAKSIRQNGKGQGGP